MTIGIYGILNKLNNKIYIGKSKNIEKRFRIHKNYLNKNKHCNNINRFLFYAVKKDSIENFDFIILESFKSINEEELSDAELYWMDFYFSFNIDFGYNLSRNSSTGIIIHDETKKLMSTKTGKLNPNYGNKWTKEQKENQSKAILNNIKQGKYDFKNTEDFENKRKFGHIKYLKNRSKDSLCRLSFIQYTKDNLIFKIYNNILEVLEQNPEYIYGCIYAACNKNKSYKGYFWKSFLKN